VYLKVFYDAILKLSGIKYPTLNLFFPEFCEVYLSIKKMCSSPYPFIVNMGTECLLSRISIGPVGILYWQLLVFLILDAS
jgi:hypothetical protein